MNNEQVEDIIDSVLCFMNDEIEREGVKINHITFNFNADGEDAVAFSSASNFSVDELHQVLKICISREFVKHQTMGGGRFRGIAITALGQARAISSRLEAKTEQESSMTIGNLTINGPAQVGNGNVQNSEYIFSEVSRKIDEADGTPEEKKEAKELLASFLKHPIVSAISGGLTSSFASLLGE